MTSMNERELALVAGGAERPWKTYPGSAIRSQSNGPGRGVTVDWYNQSTPNTRSPLDGTYRVREQNGKVSERAIG